jgi:hypothetical protein
MFSQQINKKIVVYLKEESLNKNAMSGFGLPD